MQPAFESPFATLWALVAPPPISGGKYWAMIRTLITFDPKLLEFGDLFDSLSVLQNPSIGLL